MLQKLFFFVMLISYVLSSASGVLGLVSSVIEQVDAKPGFSKEYKLNMINPRTKKKFGVKETVSVADNLSVRTSITYSEAAFYKAETNTPEQDYYQDVLYIILNVKDKDGKDIDRASVEFTYNANGVPSSSLKYGNSNEGNNNDGNNNVGSGTGVNGGNNGGSGTGGNVGNNDRRRTVTTGGIVVTNTNNGTDTNTAPQPTSSSVVIVNSTNNNNNTGNSNTKPTSSGYILQASASSLVLVLSAAMLL